MSSPPPAFRNPGFVPDSDNALDDAEIPPHSNIQNNPEAVEDIERDNSNILPGSNEVDDSGGAYVKEDPKGDRVAGDAVTPPKSNLGDHLKATKSTEDKKRLTLPRSSETDASRNSSLKVGESDKIDAIPTRSDPGSVGVGETSHLTLTETAKETVKYAARKLHLHHENARGPSEARPRRQTIINLEEPGQPLGKRIRFVGYGIYTMFFSFPYWDMAFWSGWSYSWGSILFVIDGAWAWTPQQWPSSEFSGEAKYGVGLLFFFGAILYQLGATMAYFEAINDGSFAGPAMKRHLESHDEDKKRLLDDKLHIFFGHMIPHHHHHDKDNKEDLERQRTVDPEAGWKTWDREEQPESIWPEGKAPAPRRGGVDVGQGEPEGFHEYLTWRWWPTWNALRTYHIREVGYVACAIQLFGATLYGICGVISLPGILSSLSEGQEIGGYWVPQVVASVCFLTAGIMFTLITQEKWNRPLPGRIAWWIGVWATIGSVGFL